MSGGANTKSDKVEGVVLERNGELMVLALPGTDYKLHLAPCEATPAASSVAPVVAPAVGAGSAAAVKPGERVRGRILARAKRVDVVGAGGRFVEPVIGRPRRLQGRVTAVDPNRNTFTVFCGLPLVCQPTMAQKASDFPVGSFVAFDVERGARFELAHDEHH